MAKKSTELTQVFVDEPPEIDLLKTLFENNNITTFVLIDDNTGWYRNVPTNTVEELFVYFKKATADFVSFEGVRSVVILLTRRQCMSSKFTKS